MDAKSYIGGFRVNDVIAECDDKRHRMMPQKPDKIIVHRTIWEPPNPIGMCKRFQDPKDLGSVTGCENPYHIAINGNGIYQMDPIFEVDYHARRFNISAIGICICHDTIKDGLPVYLEDLLIKILKPLTLWVGSVAGVVWGHDELKGAASVVKRCPGFEMGPIRNRLYEELAPWWGLHKSGEASSLLQGCGVVFRRGAR